MSQSNVLAIILGIVAVICGVVILLEVRTPELAIALGLMAAGAGVVALAVPR